MPTNTPGGKIISGMGGYTNVINPISGNYTRLDVARWDIDRDIRTFHKGHSGTLGAIATRVIARDWTVRGKVWWDIGNPPDDLLQTSVSGFDWGCGLQLGEGSLAGQQAYGAIQQEFWLAPSGILKRLHVLDSSEGNDDDVVMADFEIQGNCLIFKLPSQLAAYRIYVEQLTALGQITALPAYETMQ